MAIRRVRNTEIAEAVCTLNPAVGDVIELKRSNTVIKEVTFEESQWSGCQYICGCLYTDGWSDVKHRRSMK